MNFNDVFCHLLFEAVHYLVLQIVCEPVLSSEIPSEQLVGTLHFCAEVVGIEAVADVSADFKVGS